jgi:pimeloyl-ACP methyl ester carboxylesterase
MISRRVERAIPPLGAFVDVDGARVHYVDRGSGAPIVMIHGLAGVLQHFTHSLVDRLSSRFRVIALDRPGAGYSTRPRGTPASLPAQARTIARLIRSLGLERPLVVGHSLGGAIALALALEHPDIPKALALIAPLTQPETRPPKPFRGLELEPPWLRALVAHTIAVPLAIRNGPKIVEEVFAPEPAPPDFATAAGGMLGLRPSQFYNASSDMIAARDDMPQIVLRYAELTLPIHVLFGKGDTVLDVRKHGERFASQAPHVDLTVVPGGHMLPITQPDLVAAWLSSLASA